MLSQLLFIYFLVSAELLTSAVLVGSSTTTDINLVNAKTLASSKVNLLATGEGCDCVTVVTDGGMSFSGSLLGSVPVLSSINGMECGLIKLNGNVVVTKGEEIKNVVQTLNGVTEVSWWNLSLV